MASRQHNVDDVFRRLDQQDIRLLETRETVASLSSKLDSIIDSVRSLATVVNRPPPPTNWIGLGALITAIIVAAGGYMQSRLTPIERLLELHDKESRAQLYTNGATDARLQALEKRP